MGLPGTGDGNSPLTLQSMQAMISQFGVTTNSATSLNGKKFCGSHRYSRIAAFCKARPASRCNNFHPWPVKIPTRWNFANDTFAGSGRRNLRGCAGQFASWRSGGCRQRWLVVDRKCANSWPYTGGATVEQLIETDFLTTDNLILNLHQGDFSITNQVAEAVNDVFGNGVAVALDSRSVKVRAPVDPAQKVSFISMLENIEIEPERQSAKVVVNARTGTIVIGGDVRVTPAAVTHGSLTVRVDENNIVTQENNLAVADGVAATTPGPATITPDSNIQIDQQPARAFLFDPGVELSTIVEAVNAVGTSPADLVAILEALREAGSLRAELVVI